MQAGLGIGKTRSSQTLVLGGKAVLNGAYAIAEVIGELPVKSLWATLTGLYHWGDVKVRRGYLNAGAPTSSQGKPNTRVSALRGRLDWENLLCLSSFGLTLYVEGDTLHVRVDSYSETGGGFPAFYVGRRDHINEARVGLNGELPIDKITTTFIVGFEGIHRFQRGGEPISGQVIGLFQFNLPGQTYRRDWVHASIGLKKEICNGIAPLFLNGTSQGQDPRVWLAASYRVEF